MENIKWTYVLLAVLTLAVLVIGFLLFAPQWLVDEVAPEPEDEDADPGIKGLSYLVYNDPWGASPPMQMTQSLMNGVSHELANG